MKKWLWFPIGILALIGIIGIVFFASLTSGKVIGAMLYVDSGVIEVDSGKGWASAQDGMELSVNDKVRTLEGTATITFFDGELLRLHPNTEISIKELSQESTTVAQESGSTWSRLTKLGGVAEYNVETPTTVATVRGTGFGLKITGAQNDLLVGEGTVNFGAKGEVGEPVAEGWKGTIASPLVKTQLNQEEKGWVNGQMSKDIESLKKLRLELINRHGFALGIIKTTFGLTDSDIEQGLKDIDDGKTDEDEIAQKAPMKIDDLDRVVAITKEIKKLLGTAK
jgi:hypothetical protein